MSVETNPLKLKPSFIRFRFVFFKNEYPWSAWTGFLAGRKTDPFKRVPTDG
jgi:hypothetical protein